MGALRPRVGIGAAQRRQERTSGFLHVQAPRVWCSHREWLGGPRLTCTRADVCRETPRFHPLGPALLAAWLVIAAAFVIAVM